MISRNDIAELEMSTLKYNKAVESQEDFVKSVLVAFGFVSRNFCLQNYISRLGAIIHKVKNEDKNWRELVGYGVGGDYVYELPGGQMRLV